MIRAVSGVLMISGLAGCASGLSLALFNGGSLFFEPILDGWNHRCKILNITCYATVPPPDETGETCVGIRRDQMLAWADMGVTGVAMKPCSDMESMRELLVEMKSKGVSVSTFDKDVPDSARLAYVGTENEFLGRTMAKLLRQLRPEGGTYAFIGHKAEREDGFREEIERYNHRDDRAHWHAAKGPSEDFLWGYYRVPNQEPVGNEIVSHLFKNPPGNDYMPLMERAATLNPTAMIFMKQTPMRHENYTAFVDKHRHRNILYIGTDGSDFQLAYLNSRYVDGLVGQLPYEIGSESVQLLHDYLKAGVLEEEVVATNVVAFNLIPVVLPSLDVDENLIGNLKYVGYVCFGIVVVSVIFCAGWTIKNRTALVVRAAQPFFLLMVASGCLIMSGSLIPLTFDDGGDIEPMSHKKSVGICMSVPWLAFTGFTVTFSALFSKLWRVNQLFKAKARFSRVNVSEVDVLMPFAVLLTLNIAVLICWTLIDPLKYQRDEHEGTDYWNRVISTYGACQSENVFAYLVPLALINFIVVAIACWQAVKARDIQSEFSEAKYIGLAVGGLCQAFLTGIPVVVVVKDQPEAYFIVLTMVIFLVCEVILLLIFAPKIRLQRRYAGMSDDEQRRMFEQKIRDTSGPQKNSIVGVRGSEPDQSSAYTGYGGAFAVGSSNPTLSDRLASVDETPEEHPGSHTDHIVEPVSGITEKELVSENPAAPTESAVDMDLTTNDHEEVSRETPETEEESKGVSETTQETGTGSSEPTASQDEGGRNSPETEELEIDARSSEPLRESLRDEIE